MAAWEQSKKMNVRVRIIYLKNAKFIIDKTPRYCYSLNNVVKKYKLNAPIFVIYKTWKQQFYSSVIKRKRIAPSVFVKKRINFIKQLERVKFNKNVFLISYKDLMEQDNKLIIFIMHTINEFNPQIKLCNLSIDLYRNKTLKYLKNLSVGDYNFSKKIYKPYNVDKNQINSVISREKQTILNNYDKILEKYKIK